MNRRHKTAAALAVTALGVAALAGCTANASTSRGDAHVVVIGYQSKTINTVTAGTLLRQLGYFEKDLQKVAPGWKVQWQDYDTGAPITAQMLAGKIDIGSMGDYPLLINGSRAGTGSDGTSMLAVTGYNRYGALNGVVVAADSKAKTLADLKGTTISASVGSAGHGTLVQALQKIGIDPTKDVTIANQDPSVGASALQAGSVAAVSQFVAWPGVLAFRDNDRLIYDGGSLDIPTLHGTVVRNQFEKEHPEIAEAFLRAQNQATDYLHKHPVQAAERVAKATGLPTEVVYLYNGRNGISDFDTTLKPFEVAALKHDVPFLKSIGVLNNPVDVDKFINPAPLQHLYGAGYAKATANTTNAAAIHGTDRVCKRPATNANLDGEVWVTGEAEPRPVANPTCLLRNVDAITKDGGKIRATYVPDALTHTRWFADRMLWLRSGDQFLPFATLASENAYRDDHPGTTTLTYDQALAAVR